MSSRKSSNLQNSNSLKFYWPNRPKLSLLHNCLKIELMGSKLDFKELSSPTPFFHEATELLANFQLIRTSFDTNLWNLKEITWNAIPENSVELPFKQKRNSWKTTYKNRNWHCLPYLLMAIALCSSFDIWKDLLSTCVSCYIIK